MKGIMGFWLFVGVALGGETARFSLPLPESGSVREIPLRSVQPSDVLLAEPRILVDEDFRLLSFRLRLGSVKATGFLFLADPLEETVRTLALGFGDKDWDLNGAHRIGRLRSEFGVVDWNRLPGFRPGAAWKLRTRSEMHSREEFRRGLIWAESRLDPGPEFDPEVESSDDSCQDGIRLLVQVLDSQFVPLAGTSTALFTGDGNYLSKGTCWSQAWFLTRCLSVPAKGSGGFPGQIAGFSEEDPTRTGRDEQVVEAVAIRAGSSLAGNELGVFALGDASAADRLMLGVVKISRGCR